MPVRRGRAQPRVRSVSVPAGLELVFSDDFDGPLDIEDGDVAGTGAKWADKFIEFNGRHLPGNDDECIKGRGEYRGSGGSSFEELGLFPFNQAGSILLINSFEIPAANRPQFFNFPQGGGMLSSERSFRQEYGFWEIRAAFPALTPGMHQSIWLFSGLSEQARELDLIEVVGSNLSDPNGPVLVRTHNSINFQTGSDHGDQFPITILPVTHQDLLEWHRYGIEVTPTVINWFVDDALVRTVPQFNAPGSVNWYILVTPETGASENADFPGPVNASTVFPGVIALDYVRVYGAA